MAAVTAAHTAESAGTPRTGPPPATTTRPTGRPGPASAARAAVADQPGRPAGAPRRSGSAAVTTVSAIAVQDPARLARLPHRPAGPVGAVTDQRTSQQRLGGRIDQVEQTLPRALQRRRVGGFGTGIGVRTRLEGPHELVVIRRQVSAQALVGLAMPGKQRRHRRRDFIGTRGRHRDRRGRRRRIC